MSDNNAQVQFINEFVTQNDEGQAIALIEGNTSLKGLIVKPRAGKKPSRYFSLAVNFEDADPEAAPVWVTVFVNRDIDAKTVKDGGKLRVEGVLSVSPAISKAALTEAGVEFDEDAVFELNVALSDNPDETFIPEEFKFALYGKLTVNATWVRTVSFGRTVESQSGVFEMLGLPMPKSGASLSPQTVSAPKVDDDMPF